MPAFMLEHWSNILALLVAIGAMLKFFAARAEELRWRRTATLFDLGYKFDSDSDISQAIGLIYERIPEIQLENLFFEDGRAKNRQYGVQFRQLDKFLSFLERIAYAHDVMKTLSIEELRTFGAHFQDVIEKPELKVYCMRYGYESVVRTAQKLMNAVGKSELPDFRVRR
jgi:hypothetical protein